MFALQTIGSHSLFCVEPHCSCLTDQRLSNVKTVLLPSRDFRQSPESSKTLFTATHGSYKRDVHRWLTILCTTSGNLPLLSKKLGTLHDCNGSDPKAPDLRTGTDMSPMPAQGDEM